MSIRQQLLDVVIIENKMAQPLRECPDGFDDLAKHNLLTYKSHQQILDEWAIHELIGHYVNYRKQLSPSPDAPLGDFRLYAVSTRFPRNLAESLPFDPLTEGVYDIRWGNLRVRIIVLSRIGEKPCNAIWQMFSAVPHKVRSGTRIYKWRKKDVSTIIHDLFKKYETEGVAMPYTIEDYQRDYVLEHINKLPPDDRLRGLSPDDLLKALSRKDLVTALKKQLSGFTPEEKTAFVDELLR